MSGQEHADAASRLLDEVANAGEQMPEMARWERLTAANTHAMLALFEGQQQGVAVMEQYREDLVQAVDVDRERLDLAKRAEAKKAKPAKATS